MQLLVRSDDPGAIGVVDQRVARISDRCEQEFRMQDSDAARMTVMKLITGDYWQEGDGKEALEKASASIRLLLSLQKYTATG